MRPWLIALFLPLAACTHADDSDDDVTDDAALTSVRSVHQGAVQLLGSDRYRVLYAVTTAAGQELRWSTVSGVEHTLATLAAGEDIGATQPAGDGAFLVRHSASGSFGSALGVVDLRASSPKWVDAVPTPVARLADLKKGVVLYTTDAAFPSKNLFVVANGTTKQAPGTAWGDRYRLSPDGAALAYWQDGVLTRFDVATGATVTQAIDGKFDFVGGDLVGANEREGRLYKLDAAGARIFYRAEVALPSLDWSARADGTIVVAMHGDWGNPNPTQMWVVDAAGNGTFLASAGNKAPWPHMNTFTSKTSPDGRYLLDWYQTNSTLGSVWLHDLGAGDHVVSTKLLDGVSVGFVRAGGTFGTFGVSGGNALGARCRFAGAVVACTTSETDHTGVVFSVSDPSKKLAGNAKVIAPDASSGCSTTNDGIACTKNDGTSVSTPSVRPRLYVASDTNDWFGARFLFEDRDPATQHQRLSLFDPATGATELVVESTCPEGSFHVTKTANRLFVADCASLRAAR